MRERMLQRARWFVEAAAAKDHPTIAQLAERGGISKRQAHRTVKELRERHGAPLHFNPAAGGWELSDPSWKLDVSFPPDADVLAVASARQLLDQVSPELAQQLDDIRWPIGSGPSPRALRQVLLVTDTHHPRPRDGLLRTLLQASMDKHRLRFAYRSPWQTEPSLHREVSPWLVRVHDGHVYLHGFCHLRQEERCFHLDGIEEIEKIEGSDWHRPPRDLRRHVRDGFGVAGLHEGLAEVHLTGPWALWTAREVWHPKQVDHWKGDTLQRVFPLGQIDETLRRLLSCGGDATVVRPPALRKAYAEAMQRGWERNR